MSDRHGLALVPDASDQVRRLNSFRARNPHVTVNPPDDYTVDWTAHRGGMRIASDDDLGGLLDKLDGLFPLPDITALREDRPMCAKPSKPLSCHYPACWITPPGTGSGYCDEGRNCVG